MLTTNLSRRDWLKVSAVGVLGTMAPIGLSSNVFGHDQMKMPGLDFSLADVRIGQSLGIHPRTGEVTTQNERRAMVETRLLVGLWKGFGALQRMAAASPADLQPSFQRLILRTKSMCQVSMSKYGEKSLKNIMGFGRYHLGFSAYSWGKPQVGLKYIREAVSLNPAWAEKNFEPGLLSLLSIKVEKGVVSEFAPQQKVSKGGGDRPAADGNLGLIRKEMKLRPLNADMIAVLGEIERSHDAWIKAAKDKAPAGELDLLVRKHHRQHNELEHMARDHDELTLLALQHHVHDIDWTRPKAEIDKLLDGSNEAHRGWVKAVKALDFPLQWQTGLNHAHYHIMLGVPGVTIRDLVAAG